MIWGGILFLATKKFNEILWYIKYIKKWGGEKEQKNW